MKTIHILGLLAVAVTFAACTLTPSARDAVDQLLKDDIITPEQHAAIVGGTWQAIQNWLIYAGSAVILSYTGVNLRRGPATRQENVEKKKAVKAGA